MSNVLVNGAIAALASVFAMLIGNLALTQSAFVLPLGLLVGLLTFYLAGALNPDPVRHVGGRRGNQASAASSDLEEQSAKAAAKKAKKAAAEKAKREAAEEAKAEEAAAKAAAKKAAAKKAAKPAAAAAPAGKKATAVVESESESEAEKSESEAEEEVSAAPKSKSALKKAKAKAKEAAAKAEAEKAAKAAAAAEKKANKKKGAAAAEPAPVAAAAAAPAAKAKPTAAEKAASKAAAAAAAADTEGWETIEAPKPTKSQLEKQAAAAAAAAPAAKGKNAKSEPVPSSERMLTIDLQVDPEFHSRIIGPQGTTMQLLVAGSGASIDMPKRDASIRKNIVQITGTPAQVASAQNAILSLTTRGFSNLTHPGTLSDDLTVDPKDMGLIMGPNGSTVAQIQKATGTKIKLPERNSNDKKVLIVGEKDAVKAAKAALKSLITDGYSPITHPDWIKEEMDFPADRFGLLIGNKGQTIKSIQGNSKNQVRIRLPERGSKSSTVTVVGLPSAVAKARSEIEALLVPVAALPDEDLATDDAWGQEHTAQGEDALW